MGAHLRIRTLARDAPVASLADRMDCMSLHSQSKPNLGDMARDRLTHVEGVYIALTTWHDRSAECAIQRVGLDSDGKAFEVHWFPASRMVAV